MAPQVTKPDVPKWAQELREQYQVEPQAVAWLEAYVENPSTAYLILADDAYDALVRDPQGETVLHDLALIGIEIALKTLCTTDGKVRLVPAASARRQWSPRFSATMPRRGMVRAESISPKKKLQHEDAIHEWERLAQQLEEAEARAREISLDFPCRDDFIRNVELAAMRMREAVETLRG